MEGIEKITAKIVQDAQAEIARMNQETDGQGGRSIAEAGQAQADKETADTLARGQRAAQERLERLKSAAKMEQRKLELAGQAGGAGGGLRTGPGEAVRHA